ncbi:MAG: hypothetical protein ACXWE9_03740 [Methylobacter sp.]
MKKIKITAFFLTSILISGCGFSSLSTRQTNPLLTDFQGILSPWTQSISTLSPDASRRITIMRLSDSDHDYSDTKWRAGEFCAEPPPDAMVNTASQFAQALAAKIKVPDPSTAGAAAEGSGQEQFMQQIASVMTPLFRRSQGLQWNRDNLSFICNAHLNRTITRTEYLELVKDIIAKSQKLINAEMEHLPVFEWKISGSPSGAPTLLTPPALAPNP